MAHAVARAPGVPWSLRLFEAAPLTPFWIGLAVVAGVLFASTGLYLALRAWDPFLAGALHDRLGVDVRVGIVNVLILGYGLSAQVWLEDATRRALEEIRALHPGLDASLATAPFTTIAGRVAGIIGIGLIAMAVFVVPGTYRFWPDEAYWIYPHAWLVLSVFPLGWIMGRFCWAVIARSLEISQIALRVRDIDLLDPAAFAPFIRHGLRVALLWVALVSILALHLLDPNAMLGVLSTLPLVAGTAAVGLVLPVRGAHASIRAAKRARLARLRDEIRAADAALVDRGADADRAAAHLPALLALEARIAAVHEWPFDASSLLRFGFYVVLGLGSWVGAAAVERLLDVALG